jgi:hypothetical protein
MMYTILLVAGSLLAGGWERVPDNLSPAAGGQSDQYFYCQYDDGTATWFTWEGTCRAVWFHVHDFDPGSYALGLTYSEFWFYHSSVYPWDTSSFIAEVWDSDDTGVYPYLLLDKQVIPASHYSAVFSYYPPYLQAGLNWNSWFWVIANTGLSSGGWPSILSDGSPPDVVGARSYWSDDMSTWYPWEPGTASEPCDYLIRTYGVGINLSLQESTWGAIKTLF